MEYIRKEDVLGKLYLDHKDVTYIDKNAAAERIKKIQSIDIVRCKECRHWWVDGGNMLCHIHYDPTVPEHFCSYGVKKGADDE